MPELLDVLLEQTGGLYLSDLRTRKYRLKALEAALALPRDGFPLAQWQETARYLLGQPDGMSSEEEIRGLLRMELDAPGRRGE